MERLCFVPRIYKPVDGFIAMLASPNVISLDGFNNPAEAEKASCGNQNALDMLA